MRALAMTGMVTAFWISWIFRTGDIRATPPCFRMSEGTRSSAITEEAPASSAILACSALVTSMMTPPLSISASPMCLRSAILSSFSSLMSWSFLWLDEGYGHAVGHGARPAPLGFAHGLGEPLHAALDLVRRHRGKRQPRVAGAAAVEEEHVPGGEGDAAL